jgi:alkanesulfonate monooxygenase SsuD/methylene tetrahydromethanopterin reductase-like flavin-dependent oxidoreductase (luciferase family)
VRDAVEGRHVRLDKANLSTEPVQQPWMPIMIVGGGERVTLRQVVLYAYASNTGPDNLIGNA